MLSKAFRVALLTPPAYWAYLIFSGALGADPAKTLNHHTGEMALYFLLLNLIVGALIGFSFRFPPLLRFLLLHRRFLGVVTFVYLIFHVLLYFTMESFEEQAFTQIATKLYLTLGAAAWAVLLVLTLTSNNFSVRTLGGKRWKLLHRLVYLASFLITGHVLLIEKADLVKYGALFAVLWAIQAARFGRFLSKKWQQGKSWA